MIRDAQAFQTLLANAKHMTLEAFAKTFDEMQKEDPTECKPLESPSSTPPAAGE